MCKDFSSNLQNRHTFIQTNLMRGKSPMLTPKLHMSEIWSKLKKQNMSLNFLSKHRHVTCHFHVTCNA